MEKVAIVGMGTVGRAISELMGKTYAVEGYGKFDDKRGVSEADIVIMAVRPESFADAADQIWFDAESNVPRNKQLIISVMADTILRTLCHWLGSENVVRALPSPDIIFCERGLTVWMPGPRADIARAEAAISTWG
jgi:pyrroline-5-carboxylate reductase